MRIPWTILTGVVFFINIRYIVLPMYEVTVTESFSAAHYLSKYKGKCERLHGHNYTVKVTIRDSKLNEAGLVVDFGIMRKELQAVLEELDHRLLNEIPYFSEMNPSAERIAEYIYTKYREALPGRNISCVEIFETEKSRACYYPD